MKITKSRLLQIIKEEIQSVTEEIRPDQYDLVIRQIIPRYMIGRNDNELDPSSIESALSQPAAEEYFERFGVTFDQVRSEIGPTLKDIMRNINNLGDDTYIERDQNLQPSRKIKVVLKLNDQGKLVSAREFINESSKKRISQAELTDIVKEEVDKAMEETYSAGSSDPRTLPAGTKIGGQTMEEIVAAWLNGLQTDAINSRDISKDPEAQKMIDILQDVTVDQIVQRMRDQGLDDMLPAGSRKSQKSKNPAVDQFARSIARDKLSEEEGN